MRKLLALMGVLAALAMTPAAAQDSDAQADAEAGLVDIGPDEWRAMVMGRTVTYRIGGEIWAQEAYDTVSDAVAIRLADGTCMHGVWDWQDGVFCFAWSGGERSCFRHVRAQDRILVIPVQDGFAGGTIQTVSAIGDLPLACGPALSS